MNLTVGIGDVVSIVAVIGIFGVMIRNNNHVNSKVDEKIKEINGSKVEVNLCKVVHKNLEDTVKKVEKKVDCIPKIKAGLDTLLLARGLKKTDE